MTLEFGASALPEKFWANVHQAENGCWPWRGYVAKAGYGIYRGEGVHRVVMKAVADIPDGLVVDHTCHDPRACRLDNDCPHRRCCNPAHLRVTTHAQNTASGAAHHSKRENAVGRRAAWRELDKAVLEGRPPREVDAAIRSLLKFRTKRTEEGIILRTGYTRERIRQLTKGE